MNNTINNINNVSFNARCINVYTLEKLPPRISQAILKNPAIDEFIKAGQPKTIWGKIVDLFKKDEILDVYHRVIKDSKSRDRYAQDEILNFAFCKGEDKERFFEIRVSQEGVLRKSGSVAKPNEDYLYKAPDITATEQLARNIEEIKNFDILLK